MAVLSPDAQNLFGQVEAVFFDLDGTLVDTDNTFVERLAGRLRPLLGHRAAPLARWLFMQAETPGNMLVTALDVLGLDEQFMGLTDALRRRRGVYASGDFRLIPGVEELFVSLEERYRLGIVTGRSRFHIDHFLGQYPQLAEAIAVTCGLQDTRRLKPNPAPVRLAANRIGVDVTRCLMVGDTTVDVKAGRRAGAWTAAVLCGFGRRPELERAGAHLIVESTADLAGFL